jgi:hypothetical protein
MSAVVKKVKCSRASIKVMKLADFAGQKVYLAASIDARRRAPQFTGPMIAGRVCRGLPGEVPKLIYATFIHFWN